MYIFFIEGTKCENPFDVFQELFRKFLKMYLAEISHYFVLKNTDYVPSPLLFFRVVPF